MHPSRPRANRLPAVVQKVRAHPALINTRCGVHALVGKSPGAVKPPARTVANTVRLGVDPGATATACVKRRTAELPVPGQRRAVAFPEPLADAPGQIGAKLGRWLRSALGVLGVARWRNIVPGWHGHSLTDR